MLGTAAVSARDEAVVLVRIVLGPFLRLGRFIRRLGLLFAEEAEGVVVESGRQAEEHEVEDAHEAHHDRNCQVHGVGRVEDEQGDKDHKHALAILVAQELEVLEEALPSELGHQEQPCEREQVEGQDIVEGVGGALIPSEVGEADDCCGAEGQNGEQVEDLCDPDKAAAVDVLLFTHQIIEL